jgi:lysyl-tRNA synthetase class 2
VLLALVTGALLRRRRMALWLLAVFAVLGLLASVAVLAEWWEPVPDRGRGPEQGWGTVLEVTGILVSLATVWLVWWVRAAFPARTRAGAVRAAVLTLAAGMVLSAGLTHVLLLATTDTAADDWPVLGSALLRAVGLRDAALHYHRQVPPGIPLAASFLLAATIILTVFVFLRSGRRPGAWSGEQEIALRTLLASHGGHDALGYFATRRDKEALFAPDRRAVVTYRVIGSVCLASGDPVGDPAAWGTAALAWTQHARRYGWTPGVVGASQAGARAYAAAGLAVLVLGDEAVLHADRFSLSQRSLAAVSRAVRQARRAGLTVQVRRHGEVPAAELAVLGRLAETWRGGEPDRGFSMALNRWGDPADAQCVVVTAHTDGGSVVGLLSFVPWGRRGLSLDVMRRAPAAPGGTTELMVASLMDQAQRLGVREVSLNFAMFRGLFADSERLGAGAVTRLNTSVLGFFERFYQLERLYRSNAKYQPEWVPRYFCFDGLLTLPRVAVAAGQIEGFLPFLLRRHGPEHRLDEAQLAQVQQLAAAPPQPPAAVRQPSVQTRHRLRHLRLLRDAGLDPYPVGMPAPASVAQFESVATGPGCDAGPLRLAGRIRALRHHGGVLFADLVDDGRTVQAILELSVLGADRFRLLDQALDTGDLVVVTAVPGHSRTGTPSLLVRDLALAAKALHPVPYPRFRDPVRRLPQRSSDLIARPGAMNLLRQRSQIVAALRGVLEQEGYREVETPILNTVHGGAIARPFRTHSNAYGLELTLRIAPELHLKRLLVAGAGPIFEIGRNFRNEGADATHNPEFTALEAYRPFSDYTDMKELAEQLIKAAAVRVHGAARLLPHGGPAPVDISAPWPMVPVTAAVSAAVGQSVSVQTDIVELLRLARVHDVAAGPDMGPGAVLEALYGKLVEPATVWPTFYCDFPAETSPLTAPHRSHPGLVERWDLVINGMELGTGYSELTDPQEQRRRLTEQSLKAAAGDVEAMEIDEEFLYALETGMPPSGGLGLGVDRLAMLLTGTAIRDVLSFPFARPTAT